MKFFNSAAELIRRQSTLSKISFVVAVIALIVSVAKG